MQTCLGSRTHFAAGVRVSPRPSTSQVAAARSMACGSQFHLTTFDTQRSGTAALQQSCPQAQAAAGAPKRQVVRMGNKGAGGPFAPLVVVVRGVMGEKEFNKFRGKAISIHSQVIKDFGKQIGADNKQVQGLIRLAKKNGEKLGFLA